MSKRELVLMSGKISKIGGPSEKTGPRKCPVCRSDMTQTNRTPPPETWLCPKCGFKLVD